MNRYFVRDANSNTRWMTYIAIRLLESARDRLNRQLRSAISDEDLAELVIGLWQDDRLSRKQEGDEEREPRILCSLGLFNSIRGVKQDGDEPRQSTTAVKRF